jgi:glutamyl-tRNA synthetase
MHVGGVRTALFAYLLAKQSDGQFILRIEDTDKKREVEGSVQHIIECLKAVGIEWDEGVDIGGPYAPYLQSERAKQEAYSKYAEKLIQEGRAYVDPYTPEEVQAFREQAQAEKRPFLYRNHRPENPSTQWDFGMTLRFKSDPKPYEWHDEVMGDLHSGPEVIDDFVLIKSDDLPTYNFAHIIDDHEMKVSHVIRGQEFLSSMPNYLNLYEALGFDKPTFATMPHILNETGNKKLGKRDGAKDLLDYIRDGYLPETLLSFIATLGWNDGTEQEVFIKPELIEKFDLKRVQKSGARFDEKRLLWMNGQFIRELSVDELYERVADMWPESAQDADEQYKKSVLALAQDRLKTLRDLPTLTSYFFAEPDADLSLITDNKQLKKFESDELRSLLSAAADALKDCDWNPEAIQECLNGLLESTGQKPGTLFSLIRIATTWAPFSPQLNDTMHLLGKDKTLARLNDSIARL